MSGQKFPGCRVVVSGDLPGDEVVARVPEGGDLVGREALRAAGDGHRGRAEDLHLAERQHRLHASHHDRDVPAAKSVDQFIFRIDHVDILVPYFRVRQNRLANGVMDDVKTCFEVQGTFSCTQIG